MQLDNHAITVLIRGFPPNSDMEKVDAFMITICKNFTFKLSKSKKKFLGHAFVQFETRQQALEFSGKRYCFGQSPLECKFPVDRERHIQQSLEDLKYPRKVFADRRATVWFCP